jgi:hypothetical protein
LPARVALNGLLAIQQSIHRQIAVIFDVDRTFDPAQLPEGGVFPLIGQGQLAARVDDPTDDHGQAILHPRFVARVEGLVQSQLPG